MKIYKHRCELVLYIKLISVLFQSITKYVIFYQDQLHLVFSKNIYYIFNSFVLALALKTPQNIINTEKAEKLWL